METLKEILYFQTGMDFVRESMNHTVEHIETTIPLMQTLVCGGEMTAFEALERIKNDLLLEVISIAEIQKKMDPNHNEES